MKVGLKTLESLLGGKNRKILPSLVLTRYQRVTLQTGASSRGLGGLWTRDAPDSNLYYPAGTG